MPPKTAQEVALERAKCEETMTKIFNQVAVLQEDSTRRIIDQTFERLEGLQKDFADLVPNHVTTLYRSNHLNSNNILFVGALTAAHKEEQAFGDFITKGRTACLSSPVLAALYDGTEYDRFEVTGRLSANFAKFHQLLVKMKEAGHPQDPLSAFSKWCRQANETELLHDISDPNLHDLTLGGAAILAKLQRREAISGNFGAPGSSSGSKDLKAPAPLAKQQPVLSQAKVNKMVAQGFKNYAKMQGGKAARANLPQEASARGGDTAGRRKNTPKCARCGVWGHRWAGCTYGITAGQERTRICFKCGSPNHEMKAGKCAAVDIATFDAYKARERTKNA